MTTGILQLHEVRVRQPEAAWCVVRSVGDVPVHLGETLEYQGKTAKVGSIQRYHGIFVSLLDAPHAGLVELRGPDLRWLAGRILLESAVGTGTRFSVDRVFDLPGRTGFLVRGVVEAGLVKGGMTLREESGDRQVSVAGVELHSAPGTVTLLVDREGAGFVRAGTVLLGPPV